MNEETFKLTEYEEIDNYDMPKIKSKPITSDGINVRQIIRHRIFEDELLRAIEPIEPRNYIEIPILDGSRIYIQDRIDSGNRRAGK